MSPIYPLVSQVISSLQIFQLNSVCISHTCHICNMPRMSQFVLRVLNLWPHSLFLVDFWAAGLYLTIVH
jgi:hypothetical protein